MTSRLPHLIAYDIADPKRLKRVHRYLKEEAIALQYSVFVAHITPHTKKVMIRELEGLINPREDDVRIYPLPKQPKWRAWGQALWPEGALYNVELPRVEKI